MATSAVMVRSSNIIKEVGDILKVGGVHIAPDNRQQCERQIKWAQEIIAQVESTQRSQSPLFDDTACFSPLRDRIDTLNRLVVGPLSKALKASSPNIWNQLSPKVHQVRAEVEILDRTIDLLAPPPDIDREQTVKWIVQYGTVEHLRWLLQKKSKLPDHLKELGEIADQQISERVTKEYDPDGELQKFFGLNQQEFAHIVSAVDWEGKLPVALQEYTPLRTLQLIKEKLGDVVEQDEIESWLHKRNSKFDDKTPVEAINEGEAFRVLQLLIGLEEGIPD